MASGDIFTILPLIIPAVAIVVLMLLIAIARCHVLTLVVAMISLAASLVAVVYDSGQQTRQITQLLVVDGYARFYMVLIYSAALIVCIQSYGYLKHAHTVREEYYVLLLAATLGASVLASTTHFASLFIGIELLSLSLYVLITYMGTKLNVEAGVKYFVLTAVSVAFLLFGASLVYGASGTMKFQEASAVASSSNMPAPILFLAGTAMVMIGIGFKLALVPFNFWAPDVFQGAPAPLVGFLATVSKGAVFAVLMRYFSGINILSHNSLFFIFAAISVVSMFFGNITTLFQSNIKRILAYSSIAHFGYLLVALIASSSIGAEAAAFYLTAYFVTTLTTFGVITVLSRGESDLDSIDDYRGLSCTHPFYAGALTVAILSLAGIPLTAGFIAKFYLIMAGANTKLWALLIILIINSVIGLFYYLRIVIALYAGSTQKNSDEEMLMSLGPSFSWVGAFGLAVLLFLLIYLGITPGSFMYFIQTLMRVST